MVGMRDDLLRVFDAAEREDGRPRLVAARSRRELARVGTGFDQPHLRGDEASAGGRHRARRALGHVEPVLAAIGVRLQEAATARQVTLGMLARLSADRRRTLGCLGWRQSIPDSR